MNTHLRRFSEWESTVYTIIYAIISLFAIIGNGVVILAVIRKKEMRTNRNVLIVNLALSNLMLALTTIPFLWLPSMSFDFPYSNFFCKFANALPGSNIYCSTLTISVMAIDRYYSVKSVKIGSQQCIRAILLSMLIWVVSFLLSFPLLVYYNTSMLYVFKDIHVRDEITNTTTVQSYGWRQCRMEASSGNGDNVAKREEDTRTIQLAMSLLQVLFLYVIPLVVLSIFNMKLTRFLQKNSKQVNRFRATGSVSFRRGSFNVSYNDSYAKTDTDRPSPSSASQHIIVHTDKYTSAERASDRRRSRTTSLLIAMAMAYAVLWFPFVLVSVLIDMNVLDTENEAQLIERVDQACKLISILSICVNPFLYGFLNTNFRHEFTDIFNNLIRCCPKSKNCSLTQCCMMSQTGTMVGRVRSQFVRKGSKSSRQLTSPETFAEVTQPLSQQSQ